jgi:hypothetical protein
MTFPHETIAAGIIAAGKSVANKKGSKRAALSKRYVK